MKKSKRKKLKDFIKAIKGYSKGKSPKGLRVYQIDKKGKNREIVNINRKNGKYLLLE